MLFAGVRSLIICVDYHDILSVTLPHNRPQFESVLVVTSPADTKTADVAASCGADVLVTDAFYERGAHFNKYAAIEQGLDYMGRHGWICLMDADIAIPRRRPGWSPRVGYLYTPRRRQMERIPASLPEERFWRRNKPVKANEEFAGYFQMFHADDPVLEGRRYWHDLHWMWAGTGDSYFHAMWPENKKARPPFEVLHLGPVRTNWAGRSTPFADGTLHPDAEKRAGIHQALINARRGRRDEDMFAAEKLK